MVFDTGPASYRSFHIFLGFLLSPPRPFSVLFNVMYPVTTVMIIYIHTYNKFIISGNHTEFIH